MDKGLSIQGCCASMEAFVQADIRNLIPAITELAKQRRRLFLFTVLRTSEISFSGSTGQCEIELRKHEMRRRMAASD